MSRGRTRPGIVRSFSHSATALAADDDVCAVRPGGVVERAQVQKAGIAAHLHTLKPAGDAGLVVHNLGRTLQHCAFVKVELHVAVQPQCAGQVGAGGQVDGVPRAAGVNGTLQGGGIFGFAVALGPERGLGHINAVLDRRGAKFAAAHAPPGKKYISAVVCLAAQVSQGKVGAVTGGSGLAVQINGILRPGLGGCGLIPVQHGRMCGTACKNVRFKHAGSLSMMQNSVHTPLSLLLL